MRPGDPVLVRSVYAGRVRWAFPHTFVAADGDRLALYLAVGTGGVWMGRDADGYLERWARGDDPHPHVWHTHHLLWLVRPDTDWYMLGLLWDESWTFVCWYVNLQAPFRESALGFDYADLALDIVVAPDGSWAWKDEDDFAEAQRLGVLDPADAAALRAAGERVIEERPWPTGWEEWRPDPGWKIPRLPDGWADV